MTWINQVDININMAMKTVSLKSVHEVRDTCMCLHTQRAARVLARRFDTALKPVGLTNGQFSLLMSISRPQPPTIGQVAPLLAMDRTTLTAAVKTLDRGGFLKVETNPADRRERRLCISAQGTQALRAALPIWRAEHAKLEIALPRHNGEQLRALLRALE